jgi:formate hydrogenlyase subunit 4
MFAPSGIIQIGIALVLAPMMLSVINRTKAVFAGRHGQPWLQPYWDLWKLMQKSAVYSRTTTPVFVAGPAVGLAAILVALAFIPIAGSPSFVSFPGDFILVAYLLGLARFFTIAAALDTGSSFEGMGASREAFFSALAEPAILLALITLAAFSRQASLAAIYASLGGSVLASASGPALLLVTLAMMIVFLSENSRIPVDDPNTHLELTMIHEVMVLDHSGPDFAMIQYGSCLKLWILGALLTGVFTPIRSGWLLADISLGIAGMALLAVVTGIVESVMARLRFLRVPQFLIAASILSIVALILVMR